MGRIATIISYLVNSVNGSKVRVDRGGGDIVEAPVFTTPGIDSQPTSTDIALIVSTNSTGNTANIGFLDHTDKQSGPGEITLYSRDGETVMARITLSSTGSININNDNGSVILETNGSLTINGDVTVNGSISAPNIIAAGLELAGHTHGGVQTGGGTTGPNI